MDKSIQGREEHINGRRRARSVCERVDVTWHESRLSVSNNPPSYSGREDVHYPFPVSIEKANSGSGNYEVHPAFRPPPSSNPLVSLSRIFNRTFFQRELQGAQSIIPQKRKSNSHFRIEIYAIKQNRFLLLVIKFLNK